MSPEIDDRLDERIRQALAPLESTPPLRRPVGAAPGNRRWAPFVIAAACVAVLALGVVVVVARRPAPTPPPAATTPASEPRTAVVVENDQTIRLDGVTVSKGSNPVISPDGRSVAFQSDGVDGLAVQIYDGDTGQITTVLEAGGIYGYPWSPDGRLLAVSTWDGVRVVDRSGRVLVAVPDGESVPIFSPDGAQIAYLTTTGVKTVAVTGGRPQTVSGLAAFPIAWRADGLILVDRRDLIVMGTGRRIRLPGEVMVEGDGPLPVASSVDGRVVAVTIQARVSGVRSAYVLETYTGRIWTLPGSVQALSADGSEILLASPVCWTNGSGAGGSRAMLVHDVATLAVRQTVDDACSGGIAVVRDATPIVPPASTTSTPLPAAPPCRGDDLRLRLALNGGTGNLIGSLVAENASRQTCDLDGAVSIAAVDASGALVPAAVNTSLKPPQTTRQFGRSPVHWLDPGAATQVYLKLSAGCWTPRTVFQVTLPDGSQQRIDPGAALSATCDGARLPVLAYEPRFEPRFEPS